MCATVQTILDILNEIAPFESAEGFDNVGILLGKKDAPIRKVLIALDVTKEAAEEAVRMEADLIIAHHPLLFHARKNITEEDPEGEILCTLIRHHISLIAAHTNLDQSFFSGSACCAKELHLENIRYEAPYLFVGDLKAPCTAQSLAKLASEQLHFPVRVYGNDQKMVYTLAIAGGAYDEGWVQAKAIGAQALLTGEVRHHNALTASMSDFVLLDGGHYATEAPLIENLSAYLQKRLDDVQYNVRFYPSESAGFRCV